MKRFFQLPLVQIALFGTLLAITLLIGLGPRESDLTDRNIVIDDANVAHLIAGWQRTWNRMPTKEELQGLIKSYIRDEISYREAINQGLDKNNAVIRRALITQMGMLAESQSADREIPEEDLKAYYDLRKEQFSSFPQYQFTQVYFNKDLPESRDRELIDQLNSTFPQGEPDHSLGSQSMLPKKVSLSSAPEIDRDFGEGFSDSLASLPVQQWSGPVTSSFGTHFIFLSDKKASEQLPFELVKEDIRAQMLYEEKEAAKELFYTELLQQYKVSYQGVVKEIIHE